MKKIILLLLLILLSACGNIKQEDLYTLNVDGQDITVGYDGIEVINEKIDSYSTYTDKNENEILNKVVVYLADTEGNVLIDGTLITCSISETCSLLNGELENKNGYVCLVSKRVKKHDNYVLIYGDILDDNLDKTDRVEVYFNEN